ncbi:MAG: hypothetical protein U5L95_01355 [Candidatus Saccharibacteria bacterium]|nr:hypothetical protein [Candidatus Saccharibacteria bacterium]
MTDQYFPELFAEYTKGTRLSTQDIDPESLEITFPNGESGSIDSDAENFLAVNGLLPHGLKRDQILQIGIIVGAALHRDGLLPSRFDFAVESVSQGKMVSNE